MKQAADYYADNVHLQCNVDGMLDAAVERANVLATLLVKTTLPTNVCVHHSLFTLVGLTRQRFRPLAKPFSNLVTRSQPAS